jgi:hypothetical protein
VGNPKRTKRTSFRLERASPFFFVLSTEVVFAGGDFYHRIASERRKGKMDEVFTNGSVPVAVAARVYGKDASWIRAGIVSGWLPIGKATRNGKLVTRIEDMDSKYGRINFYISPKLLWEETGYIWKGEKHYGNRDTTETVQEK